MTTTAFTPRQYTSNDIPAIVDLLNLCDQVDQLDDSYSIENIQSEHSAPGVDTARDLGLWENERGQLVAYAETIFRDAMPEDTIVDGYFYARIHPDYRHVAFEDEIVAWAETRFCEQGRERHLPTEMRAGMPDTYDYMLGILQRHGFAPVRYFLRMVRDLAEPIAEPHFAAGYTLRCVASAEDEQGWVDAYNMSFIDHYNFHTRTLEAHRHSLSEAPYSRERDLIAVAEDGSVAAFAFCWIDSSDNQRNNRQDGWVSVLGVRRGHRKIGLGKAMLLAGMRQLKADGMAYAKLGVDAENPSGALHLYESTGFINDRTWVQYLKQLA